MLFKDKMITLALVFYSLSAPISNVLLHSVDYLRYSIRENSTNGIERSIYHIAKEMSLEEMTSPDVLLPLSYEKNKIKIKYEEQKPIQYKPEPFYIDGNYLV